MKTLKFFFIAILGLFLFSACEKSADESFFNEDRTQIKNDNLKANPHSQRSIPFKADFYTLRNYDSTGICSEGDFTSFNYQVGEGTGTHLGKFANRHHQQL